METIDTIFGTFEDVHHDYHYLKFQGKPEGSRHKHWSVAATENGTEVSLRFGNQDLTIDKANVPGLIFALEKVGLYRRPTVNETVTPPSQRGYARDSKGRFISSR